MTQAIKFCPRPVVVAPYGMCLGGGTEIALHAAARQPHAELYMGLVETGVGLIPAGGGCKEMLLRAIEAGSSIRPDARGEGVEMFEALKKNFETIAMAKVSTSAAEARGLGFLRAADGVTMNRARLLTDAKRAGAGAGGCGICGAGDADGYSGAGRERAGDAEAGGVDDARGGVHLATTMRRWRTGRRMRCAAAR